MRVKIMLFTEKDIYEGYDSYSTQKLLIDSVSDWEEISVEDFHFLRCHMPSLKQLFAKEDVYPVIVIQDNKPIIERIESIKEEIVRMQANLEKQRKQRDQVNEQRKQKKIQSEKELFLKLRKKFEKG